jgi:hypothetical protein
VQDEGAAPGESEEAYEVRRCITKGAFAELRAACVRLGGELTSDFLDLEREIDNFASLEDRHATVADPFPDGSPLSPRRGRLGTRSRGRRQRREPAPHRGTIAKIVLVAPSDQPKQRLPEAPGQGLRFI